MYSTQSQLLIHLMSLHLHTRSLPCPKCVCAGPRCSDVSCQPLGLSLLLLEQALQNCCQVSDQSHTECHVRSYSHKSRDRLLLPTHAQAPLQNSQASNLIKKHVSLMSSHAISLMILLPLYGCLIDAELHRPQAVLCLARKCQNLTCLHKSKARRAFIIGMLCSPACFLHLKIDTSTHAAF